MVAVHCPDYHPFVYVEYSISLKTAKKVKMNDATQRGKGRSADLPS